MLIWSPTGMRGCRELEHAVQHRLHCHGESLSDLLFYGDGSHVATCAMDGGVAVRDLRRAEDVVTPFVGHEKVYISHPLYCWAIAEPPFTLLPLPLTCSQK